MTQVLLKAAPHKWGEGKIHVFDTHSLKTMCGKTRDRCPGEVVDSFTTEPDCLLCRKAMEAEERQAESQRQWEQREREREEERQRRRAEYSLYLVSTEWAVRRAAVLQRANNLCEGCGRARATQVHHLTYDRIFREMFFDLVAVCESCHRELHSQ